MSAETIQFNSHTVELSNINKIFFPDAEITKGDLIDYYRRIADTMLPHLRQRAIVMHRYPDGLQGEGFVQQDMPDYFPDWVERVTVQKKGGRVTHPVCNEAATLVYLANQACTMPHVWLSRVETLNYPDRLIFDLDPPGNDFTPVREAARSLHQLVEEIGLVSFVTTTGSRGLHVVIPLDASWDFDRVRTFAQDLAEVLRRRDPENLTTEQYKEKRGDRLFLDTKRNAYAQTAVAPYAVRMKPGAPIATPLDWDELTDSDLHSQRYTIGNIFRRLGQKADPWQNIARHARSLDEPRQRLDDLLKT
jgi:bifunctional non-homologous end joining protein LigD